MSLPTLVHNRLSCLGAGIASPGVMTIVFLFIVNTLVAHGQAPYAGLMSAGMIVAVLHINKAPADPLPGAQSASPSVAARWRTGSGHAACSETCHGGRDAAVVSTAGGVTRPRELI